MDRYEYLSQQLNTCIYVALMGLTLKFENTYGLEGAGFIKARKVRRTVMESINNKVWECRLILVT